MYYNFIKVLKEDIGNKLVLTQNENFLNKYNQK